MSDDDDGRNPLQDAIAYLSGGLTYEQVAELFREQAAHWRAEQHVSMYGRTDDGDPNALVEMDEPWQHQPIWAWPMFGGDPDDPGGIVEIRSGGTLDHSVGWSVTLEQDQAEWLCVALLHAVDSIRDS